MKIEIESVKNLVCSQVFSWKLKCTKTEWDNMEKRISFNLEDGYILRNVFKQCEKSGKPRLAGLMLSPEAEGKRRFRYQFVPDPERKFEHRVSVKVRDESKLLVTPELTTFLSSNPDNRLQWDLNRP